ncbi:MAG: type II toxin-antitoxin system VapC family toxin [Anaerolineales bacterium]|uniref:type II toxin-antitoxin system VapC family toxin n=1 Tax=Candidatus Villigracilis vicinus TaxID=3140679 RepID=UPI0031358D9A|nr:type II toxin-antitoxin system VapC family toxin [Anaerolineales bacterium]MBK7450457.1 type II toxin-antitoxin system VapC family toxin [Anaerolineales bacterium]MBK9780290.1 type II toxin-antitoxin system VapC family toxin [Anaerolineales bacterium]
MSDYLIDTNILILYLRKTAGYYELLDTLAADDALYISAITRLEIIRGMRDREREATFDILDSLETIEINIEIADKAGELIRTWRTKGVVLEDADALIAASALEHSLALVTTNSKHFPMPDLVVYQADNQGKLTLRK